MDVLNLRIDFLITKIDIRMDFLQIRMDNFNLPVMDILSILIIPSSYRGNSDNSQRNSTPRHRHTTKRQKIPLYKFPPTDFNPLL
jgi:hypothetical protein